MRLNAFLARAGVASRRRADELIKAGRVTVNGEPGQLNAVVGARDRALGPGQVELVLHEGRKHQVKRMLAAAGHPVTRLHRSAYAGLTLEGLEPGQCRELEPSEVERLRSMLRAQPPGRAGYSPD